MKNFNTFYFAADTESTQPTGREDIKGFKTRIWGCGYSILGTSIVRYHNNIKDMFTEIVDKTPTDSYIVIYFHNLSHDASLILSELLKDEYKATEQGKTKKKLENKQFQTLITGDGMWYRIRIKWKGNQKNRTIELRDSLKILPFSLKQLAVNMGLSIQKIDEPDDFYRRPRPEGWIMTEEEKQYLHNDVVILKEALEKVREWGLLDHLTIASAALSEYKKIISQSKFDELFPLLDKETDKELRRSYKGGWCYVDKQYKANTIKGKYYVYDVNSLFPYVMSDEKFEYPVGKPIGIYDNEDDFDDHYDEVFIIKFKCEFELRDNKLPFIQIKNSVYANNEHLERSEYQETLTLTKPDFELFFKNYRVHNFEFIKSWHFKSINGKTLFNKYIAKWNKLKETAGNNKVQRLVAKLFNNSFYGKFGTNPYGSIKIPYLNEETGKMEFIVLEDEKKSLYIPIASFVTSYARQVTITAAAKAKEFGKFYYSDTDSIHVGMDMSEYIPIDDVKLGHWKLENTGNMCKFVRQKTYIELHEDGKLDIKACGCPDSTKQRMLYKLELNEDIVKDENGNIINEKRSTEEIFNRFTYGMVEGGKLQKRLVEGGYILCSTTFRII